MLNNIYDSPFPKINPKVRYRTALERAGFEVNVSAGATDSQGSASRQVTGQGLAAMSYDGQNPSSTFISTQSHVSTDHSPAQQGSNSTPEHMLHQPPRVKITAPSNLSHLREDFRSTHTEELYHYRNESPNPSLVNEPLGLNQDSDSFDFEKAQNYNYSEGLHPIEKSFQMLTQSDTDLNEQYSNHDEPHERYTSTIESLNFEADPRLQIGLAPSEAIAPLEQTTHIPVGNNPVADVLPLALPVRNDANEGTARTDAYGVSPMEPRMERSAKNSTLFQVEKQEGNETSTNFHLEQLIAQLDDVSLTRNEKLTVPNTTPQHTSMDDQYGSGNNASSHANLQPSSVDNHHFKKSSAYLSGYPSTNWSGSKTIPQVINHPGHIESFVSAASDSTPIMYKFKDIPSSASDFATANQENLPELYPTLKPHQEVPDENSLNASTKENQELSQLKESEIVQEKQERTEKYPPGEGPCRLCGLEVTGRRLFSKKAGELSGQWHRDCFRCIKCRTKFNKATPCYILDDKPYCQQHYHEENNSICGICSKFIEGECLENDNHERFHVNCLTCFRCRKPITNDYFIFNGEIALCSNHDIESLLKTGLSVSTDEESKKETNNTISRRRTRLISFGMSY
ncbi:hypothetical protein KAFR_0H00270 [Kazachstania africana CBS 2517]|uniref:LIM zinc-binding domain-containing protein n=1 Tax=Kazachstania africana (strain ATCC 22294 / BCRC 22015 / CBS 2517 / CECT 1963 / NBRC 1671 / NRRL Y-8276) TaxID=1071382 RepID=H2AYN0_KAZAF|nr:hypothetical protein KAFR_0H00270 [Kazachstania africana CBS 2517]CCF59436.1 hypothetical protein KAFR_0H00270 [Kazachstania africana CBS 2517]